MKPATRKVVQRSPAHTVRLIHLPHLQAEPIEADSKLERDFVHIAALFPFIKSIAHQPFKLVWEDRSYTPDFLLIFQDGSKLVVEVKPASMTEGYEDLFLRSTRRLEEYKIGFLVATDKEITIDRAHNALLIRRYAKTSISEDIKNQIVGLIKTQEEACTVRQVLCIAGSGMPALCQLVSTRRVATTSDLSLTQNACLSIPAFSMEVSHAIQFTGWFNN